MKTPIQVTRACSLSLLVAMTMTASSLFGGGTGPQKRLYVCEHDSPTNKIQPPADGGMSGNPSSAGNPIRIVPHIHGDPDVGASRMAEYDQAVDLLIPVKHGLSLEVSRSYSSIPFTLNHYNRGMTGLGYYHKQPTNGVIDDSWHLTPYESTVFPSAGDMTGWNLVWITPEGEWIPFRYAETINVDDTQKLFSPDGSHTGNLTVSVYYPEGDPRRDEGLGDALVEPKRRTALDIVVYAIHPYETVIDEAADLVDPDFVVGFVLRYSNGRQLHYDTIDSLTAEYPSEIKPCSGLLRYIDDNWRNNVVAGEANHVDDYLEVEWTTSHSYGGSGGGMAGNDDVPAIDRVKAPPSDGRELVFNHPLFDDPEPFTHISSVSLRVPIDSEGNYKTYDDLVTYQYYEHRNGMGNLTDESGMLWRVWIGSDGSGLHDEYGIQYDYGQVYDGTGFVEDFHENAPNIFKHKLSRKSLVIQTGVSTFDTIELSRRGSWRITLPGQTYDNYAEWFRDPVTPGSEGSPVFRAAFHIHKDDIALPWFSASKPLYQLTWDDGQIGTDTMTRYTPDSDATASTMVNLTSVPGDFSDRFSAFDPAFVAYANSSNPPPVIRQELIHDPSSPSAHEEYNFYRMPDKTYLLVVDGSTESWVVLEDLDYGAEDEENGIYHPTKITKYAGMRLVEGETDEWEADPDTKLETFIVYGDADVPDFPTSITQPDGARVTMAYDAKGRLEVAVSYQFNSDPGVLDFDTLSTTTYTYVDDGSIINDPVNEGLVETITVEPASGPVQVTTFTYTDPEDGDGSSVYNAGKVYVVTVDDKPTTYTYNDFGDVKSITTEHGTATNNYSDELEDTDPDYFIPGRLLKSVDPAGDTVVYTYNNRGQIATITGDPDGEPQETQYTYDIAGNVTMVTAPDTGETTFAYSIYGKVLEMTDPEESVTSYRYDAFGRVIEETVSKDATTLHHIFTTYAGTGGSGCGSCGGGSADQVAVKMITNADQTTTETLTFKYDLLGRLVSSNESNFDATTSYTYDFAEHDGTRLTEIDQDTSYEGDDKVRYEYDEHNHLKREIGNFGRYTEFGYDISGRLTQLKDPFGFITKLGYDDGNKGKLEDITHSTLGTTTFEYNADDTLLRYRYNTYIGGTDYVYDAFGRLQALESFRWNGAAGESVGLRGWAYDPVGRKGDISLDIFSNEDLTGIELDYDEASRLEREELVEDGGPGWEVGYDYDEAGNRTLYDPGASYTISYGAGNREATVDSDVLTTYDFKGNVIAREGLVSGIGYTYEWNAYDRMTLAYNDDLDLYGGYDYDGLGRMNGRLALNLGDSRFRGDFPTWVGLNKLCEERYLGIGDGDFILRPDDESTDDPNDAGWASFLGLETQEYVTDTERGKVVHLAGDDWSGGAIFQIGDTDNDDNPYNAPWEYVNGRVTMWFRNNNISEPVTLAFECMNDMDDPIELAFMTDDGSDVGTPGVTGATFYIGSAINDGEWHYLEFDLVERMQQFGEAPEFTRVDALLGYGLALDINFDDFVIGNGLLGKSYQIIPGAAIGGVIGTQCGAAGSHTDDFYTTATMPAWSKYFYNYNDLGTVVSTVDDTGAVIGIYEPDFFGNYRYVDGERPDNIGLTSKPYDQVAGGYDFGFRTLDPERARWLSREPKGLDGPNLYHFALNNPVNEFDPDGRAVVPLIDPSTIIAVNVAPMQILINNMNECGSQDNILNNKKWISRVQPGGDWDYKLRITGEFGETFGNMNYGATGTALGMSGSILDRGAGFAQKYLSNAYKPEFGRPFLSINGPFGDDPSDTLDVECGCKLAKWLGYPKPSSITPEQLGQLSAPSF